MSQSRGERGARSPSTVDVKPEVLVAADLADGAERIDHACRRGADGRRDEEGSLACLPRALDLIAQIAGAHTQTIIDVHDANGIAAEPGVLRALPERMMRCRRDEEHRPPRDGANPSGPRFGKSMRNPREHRGQI